MLEFLDVQPDDEGARLYSIVLRNECVQHEVEEWWSRLLNDHWVPR